MHVAPPRADKRNVRQYGLGNCLLQGCVFGQGGQRVINFSFALHADMASLEHIGGLVMYVLYGPKHVFYAHTHCGITFGNVVLPRSNAWGTQHLPSLRPLVPMCVSGVTHSYVFLASHRCHDHGRG